MKAKQDKKQARNQYSPEFKKQALDRADRDGVVTWPNGADIDPAWMYEQVRANKSWSVPF